MSACLYPRGFPKLADGGGLGELTYAGRLSSSAGWLLGKVTLTSVVPGSPKPPFYHVKCPSAVLAYLNTASFPLSRKVLATQSVTGGFMHPKLCLPIL